MVTYNPLLGRQSQARVSTGLIAVFCAALCGVTVAGAPSCWSAESATSQESNGPAKSKKTKQTATAAAWKSFTTLAKTSKSGVHCRIGADTRSIAPGATFRVGVLFELDPNHHIYYKKPGGLGLPTNIKWKLPDGFRAGELQWPAPKKIVDNSIKATSFVYDKRVLLYATITAPKSLQPGAEVSITALADWLVCEKDECTPGKANLILTMKTGDKQQHSPLKPAFDATEKLVRDATKSEKSKKSRP